MKNKFTNKTNYILGIMLTLVIIIAVILASVTAGRQQKGPFHTNGEYAQGIDVSSHNGEIDWQTVSENTEFAIIRAGYRGYGNEGTITEDKNFKENIENANAAGLPVGVYFYTQAVNEKEAEEEAEFVIKLLHKMQTALPVFIDFEYPYDASGNPCGRMYDAKLSRDQATANINAFCKKIRHAGFDAGVYSSSSVYNFHLSVGDFDDDTCIWVADYNKAVTFTGEYDIWQYSKTGSCPGVNSKYCDVNRWYSKK